MCTLPVLSRVCLESYNEPLALYERLKQRGMDLVTVTDHDSIDAAEELRRYPDFFLSEEVTCTMPSGTEMHAGVYGIDERDHIELQRRRHDIESLLAYAEERRLFVTVNHIYSGLTGRRTDDDFAVFARNFHGVETLNGQILGHANRLAASFARRFNKPGVGGSDSHTLGGVARTWTEVPGSTDIAEFLAGMRRGHGIAEGESGSYLKLTAAVCEIGASLVTSAPRYTMLAALIALIPLVTLGIHIQERAFAWYWGQRNRFEDAPGVPEVIL
jgi:predicted metal-dependent phosphoesterase TrpH